MDEFVTSLVEELNCETVFTIPLFGGIGVSESVVVSWFIILLISLFCIIFVRNLKVENPGKKQLLLETAVDGMYNMIKSNVGEHGKEYIPYLMTVFIYLVFANLSGLFGFKPPTKDLNITAGLALMSIVVIEFAHIRKHGFLGRIKAFGQPIILIAPLNILEIVIRPLSLCMRLFGNILGGFVVMELIKITVPLIIPVPFSFYFDIFDGLIQAYIFVFLTSIFIGEAVE